MKPEVKWPDLASLDGTRLVAAANRLLPPWVSLGLVVLVAWQLAGIAWSLVPGAKAGDPVAVAPRTPAPEQAASTNVQAIADAHLFGVASDEPAAPAQPAPSELDDLSDTRLSNLSLRGTFAATPVERAIAIIADSSNDEKIYVVGQIVTAGATLHAVYNDRVVLNENGLLTNLRLPKEYSAQTASVARRNTMTTARTMDNTQSIQAVVASNVSQLADVIRPTPYFENGQQQGYRVYPGRNRQQFAALGLQPGDLIKDIDGQALTDPETAAEIFRSLGNADQVSVTVERNGQPEVIVLSTSQLDLAEDENSQ